MQKHLIYYLFVFVISSTFMCCNGCQQTGVPSENGTETSDNTEPGTKKYEEQVTPNGFRYVHLIQNDGPKPKPGEYAYYDLDILGIKDSLSEPVFLAGAPGYNKISNLEQKKEFVSPIIDVLESMSIGDSVIVKVSPDYVKELQPSYLDFAYLNFCIKLTDIMSGEEHSKLQVDIFNKRKEKLIAIQSDMPNFIAARQKTLADYNSGKLGDNLITSSTGLQYFIHDAGTGHRPEPGNSIQFFYCGLLMDGTIFENTFETGAIATTQVGNGQGLLAFEEAFFYLKNGAKVTLFVPHHLAYGEEGYPPNVPPKTDVMFYLELFE